MDFISYRTHTKWQFIRVRFITGQESSSIALIGCFIHCYPIGKFPEKDLPNQFSYSQELSPNKFISYWEKQLILTKELQEANYMQKIRQKIELKQEFDTEINWREMMFKPTYFCWFLLY